MVGHDDAVDTLSAALCRASTGLQDKSRPIGAFLFAGPTGVGKTALASALAAHLFDDKESLIRIDMSEFMEKHAVSKLIGAPPGYVGFEDGGMLCERVRRTTLLRSAAWRGMITNHTKNEPAQMIKEYFNPMM